MQSALGGSGWHSAQQRMASALLQLCWPKILRQTHDDDKGDDDDKDGDDGGDEIGWKSTILQLQL